MSCLHIKNLSVTFSSKEGPVYALDNISLTHMGEETLALIGETGCGKSVVAHSIMRLLPKNAVTSGEIFFHGKDLLKAAESGLNEIRGQEIALILQNPSLALNPIQKIGKQIAEPLLIHQGMEKRAAGNIAKRTLEQLGFEKADEKLNAYPFQFSGGMNQRVLIAGSLVCSPRIIIADEPTKGLDDAMRDEVIKELWAVKERNSSSLLLISHDFEMSTELADRIAVMYGGEIIEVAPRADFLSEPLHPYAKALVMSLPENGFKPIPGPPIEMTRPPAGCKFHPRCRYRMPRCIKGKPPMFSRDERRVRCFLYA